MRNDMATERPSDAEFSLRRVVEILEEEIVLGLIHPRQRLIEDELLRRFKLKRHAVRQALSELESMGMVERKRHVGAVVRAYSVREVQDLYVVRELLETHCARLISYPVRTESLDALLGIQQEHDEAVSLGNPRRGFRANMAFHKVLFGLSENPVLVEAIQYHAQRAHSIRSYTMTSPAKLQRARREHWGMIEALQKGDTEGLVHLCGEHLKPSRDAYIAALENAGL